jgi:hypothetical protein
LKPKRTRFRRDLGIRPGRHGAHRICRRSFGDAACAIPPVTIPQKHIDTIEEYTRRIAVELQVSGVMNIQYAICKDIVYVLEANPALPDVPLVSKVCNIAWRDWLLSL